ncbi:MAG: hypothetical protein J7K75_08520 [Desulfuromonas sp.]|nr:hypothetical protein [Desulfuromonas sp.]
MIHLTSPVIIACAVVVLYSAVYAVVMLRHKPSASPPQTLYLVGRIRIPNGRRTVWDVMGIVDSIDQAQAACTTKADFYVVQQIGMLRDDDTIVPAQLIFPIRAAKQAKKQAEAGQCL